MLNWLLYTYLVPAAALLGAATVVAPRETLRATAWERENLYGHRRPLGALACGVGGVVVVFRWINLAIAAGSTWTRR